MSQKYLLGIPRPKSEGDLVENPSSAVYDKYLENLDFPHAHEMLVQEIVETSVSSFGKKESVRTLNAESFRTLYALQMVKDSAPESLDFARKAFEAIISDYDRVDMGGISRNLSALSEAVEEVKESPEPFAFWKRWWRRNRSEYASKDKPKQPPTPKRYEIRPTIRLGDPREYFRPKSRPSSSQPAEAAQPDGADAE